MAAAGNTRNRGSKDEDVNIYNWNIGIDNLNSTSFQNKQKVEGGVREGRCLL